MKDMSALTQWPSGLVFIPTHFWQEKFGMSDQTPLEITVQELSTRRASGDPVTILDVREPQELAICKIDGSLDIPMQSVPANLDRLKDASLLVVVCHSGMRSMQVTRWLRQNGIDQATNLMGGIDSWAREIDSNMATY
jgi:rhodanese-related sulfurtransferase